MAEDQGAQMGRVTETRSALVGCRGPLALWALLLASFLAVAVLYATFAEPFVLKVYEMEQIGRANIRSVNGAILDYDDYLRADPSSIRIRGRIVSALIASRRYPEAIEHAKLAVEYADESERTVAQLIAARAHLATGDIDTASSLVEQSIAPSPDSGEAQSLRARIAAAQGEFADMDKAYAHVRALGPRESSQEYREEWDARTRDLATLKQQSESSDNASQHLYEYGDALELLGRIDEATVAFLRATELTDTPSAAVYWSGLYAERAGDLTEALKLYQQATRAPSRHPNAVYAYARLNAGQAQ